MAFPFQRRDWKLPDETMMESQVVTVLSVDWVASCNATLGIVESSAWVMNYLIAVLSDRLKAEAAYTALEAAEFAMDEVTILGQGYKSADEFGLIDPANQAWQQVKLMMLWLVPFGFIAGFGFNAITGLDTFPWAGTAGNQIIGGLLGAGSGALGAFFVGGGAGAAFGSGDALSYRNRLNAGKYLIVLQGSDSEIRMATPIVRRFRPENIQGYQAPVSR